MVVVLLLVGRCGEGFANGFSLWLGAAPSPWRARARSEEEEEDTAARRKEEEEDSATLPPSASEPPLLALLVLAATTDAALALWAMFSS